jgi:hypothetical protein
MAAEIANQLALTLIVLWGVVVLLCALILLLHVLRRRAETAEKGYPVVLTLLFTLLPLPCIARLLNVTIYRGESIGLDWQEQTFLQVFLGSSGQCICPSKSLGLEL